MYIFETFLYQIAKLTNEYYHLIPIYGFEDETIQPISDKKMLRDHTKLLADLMDLEVANNILLGANLKKTGQLVFLCFSSLTKSSVDVCFAFGLHAFTSLPMQS